MKTEDAFDRLCVCCEEAEPYLTDHEHGPVCEACFDLLMDADRMLSLTEHFHQREQARAQLPPP